MPSRNPKFKTKEITSWNPELGVEQPEVQFFKDPACSIKQDWMFPLTDRGSIADEEDSFIKYWLPLVDCVIVYSLLRFNDQSWSYDIPEPFLPFPTERFVCQNPFVDTFILPNGDVTLCCETLLMSGREKVPVMGNILNESLQEIWSGANYNRVRDALTSRNYAGSPICEKCRIWASWRSEVSEAEGIRTTRNYTTKIVEKTK